MINSKILGKIISLTLFVFACEAAYNATSIFEESAVSRLPNKADEFYS
ncbi:hypothetical protein I2486_14745 [Cellulophaga sp. E16_2]|nr:hypothetical protein [Cellulophaga sp. E16_2]MBO0592660.1 hypothetical protein [Cellulophaga sp. E16_2]